MTAAEEQLVAEMAKALRYEHGSSHEELALDDEMWADLAAALLPVVLADRRRAVAEALREAAEWWRGNGVDDVCADLRARADTVEGGGR